MVGEWSEQSPSTQNQCVVGRVVVTIPKSGLRVVGTVPEHIKMQRVVGEWSGLNILQLDWTSCKSESRTVCACRTRDENRRFQKCHSPKSDRISSKSTPTTIKLETHDHKARGELSLGDHRPIRSKSAGNQKGSENAQKMNS